MRIRAIHPLKITFLFLLQAGILMPALLAQNMESFDHLSVRDGLSQSTIFTIRQDADGFMWFGTRGGGLNRYDGYDFRVYRNIPGQGGSLSDNEVISILEDSRGQLWVGTRRGGINRYDRGSGKFTRIEPGAGAEVAREASLAVRVIFEDRSGQIWIGTNRGIYVWDAEEGQFLSMLNDAPFPIRGTTGICEDEAGYLYFSTWDRLVRYSPRDGEYEHLSFAPDPFADFGGRLTPLLLDSRGRLWIGTPGGLKTLQTGGEFRFEEPAWPGLEWPPAFSEIRCIRETRDGKLWFGTKNGLFAFDSEELSLKTYRTDPSNPASLNHNSVYSLYEDRVGTLWIGTWSGISILDRRKYEFKHYAHMHNDPQSLSNNIVSSFQEDGQGTWIGTEQGGLNYFDREKGSFRAYLHDPENPESLPSNNVKSVFLDSRGELWVGTFVGGLSRYRGGGRFENFLEKRSVYSIIEYPEGRLWFGGRTGLHSMDLDSREISKEVFPAPAGMRRLEAFVSVLYLDKQERIWIGTRNEGLYLFDPQRESLKNYRSLESDSSSLSGDNILSICEDPSGSMWFGTTNGLNRFDEPAHSFEQISPRLGIADYVINGLLCDGEGLLWISTNTGLYAYDHIRGEISHYDHLDGLQSNEFNRSASYRNKNGEMYFGGVNGFNIFHPAGIRKNNDAPPVIISELLLFNEPVIPGEKNSPLDEHISRTDKLVLSHRQSSFGFEFVALNYLVPEKNNYAYMLEGYEADWNYCGRTRSASYMNLKPGNYTFRVKGSNNDNVWNEAGDAIAVQVKGPFWSSPLAIVIYIVFLLALLLLLIRIVRFRAEKEKELELERAEKARMKEMNQARLQFFTNVSHEFRTPLTLMSGPLDKLMAGGPGTQSDYLLGLMRSNVNRMLRLVNQLMDFRKLDNDKMQLRAGPGNLDDFLSQIVLGFEDLAESRMIELSYHSPDGGKEREEQYFDEGIVDKVVYNLLSNAFKFTPEHGIIGLSLHIEGKEALIEVRDTGKGIAPEKVKRIFERYYSDSPELYTGTGIGLSLSKRLIDLHRGSIEVESEKGKGAAFRVRLPVARESFSEEELIGRAAERVHDRPGLDLPLSSPGTQTAIVDTGDPGSSTLILIAEDNPEMSSFLADHFSSCRVILAPDGKLALEKAREEIPDIIISDVMMPEMDGIAFCRAVKQEYLTSHIPVVLLTAKAAIDEKIEGMETGADAYVEKPFDAGYLSALVSNLLAQRKKLVQKYSGLQSAAARADEEQPSPEDAFLQKVNGIIGDHISDAEFSLEDLLSELAISRSQLYRKFKIISERNPSEYIRIVRLQHASGLLRDARYTVSEVAYMSGFNNVSYFNTCFKRYYGTTPGKYQKDSAL